MDNPARIMEALADIGRDLASRQLEYEQAAGDRARLTMEVEYQEAVAYQRAKAAGAGATDARQAAKAAVGESQEWLDLKAAEATYDAAKAAISVLTTRSSIGQSILRAQGNAGSGRDFQS